MLFADVIGGLYTLWRKRRRSKDAPTRCPLPSLNEGRDVELVDPVTNTALSAEDELDAAWVADAHGVDPVTGDLCDTPGAS